MTARTTVSGHRDIGGSIERVETTTAGTPSQPRPLIPAADLEPTAAEMAEARRYLAAATDFAAARTELGHGMCHVEALGEHLAAGDVVGAARRMRLMLATLRAHGERRAELLAESDARLAEARAERAAVAE